jgi:hypothetical protein
MPEQKRRTQRPDRNRAPHHIADEPVGEVTAQEPADQSPLTDTGLVVEAQIQKEWDQKKDSGLPTFLKTRAKTGTR